MTTVAVVESDADIREALTSTLTEHGYKVLPTVAVGDLCSSFTDVDVVLIDVLRNDPQLAIDSISTLRKRFPGVRIAIMSTSQGDLDSVAARMHVDLTLPKPFSLDDLLRL